MVDFGEAAASMQSLPVYQSRDGWHTRLRAILDLILTRAVAKEGRSPGFLTQCPFNKEGDFLLEVKV